MTRYPPFAGAMSGKWVQVSRPTLRSKGPDEDQASSGLGLKRFQAKWKPVRHPETPQIIDVEPKSNSVRSGSALGHELINRVDMV